MYCVTESFIGRAVDYIWHGFTNLHTLVLLGLKILKPFFVTLIPKLQYYCYKFPHIFIPTGSSRMILFDIFLQVINAANIALSPVHLIPMQHNQPVGNNSNLMMIYLLVFSLESHQDFVSVELCGLQALPDIGSRLG